MSAAWSISAIPLHLDSETARIFSSRAIDEIQIVWFDAAKTNENQTRAAAN
jgi:hypothetical protein